MKTGYVVNAMLAVGFTIATALVVLNLHQSKAITYIEWQQRPLVEKLLEHSASLLRLQL